ARQFSEAAREGAAAEGTAASAEAGAADLVNAKAMIAAADGSRAEALAAYRLEPLTPKALMIAALAEREEAKKAQILSLASQLNRRDLSLQGLVMQQHLAAEDFPRLVQTLDQILRVHPEAASRFFPVLQRALIQPGTGQAFEQMLDGSSLWHKRFLDGAVQGPATRAALADIRPAIGVEEEDLDRRLITGLVEQGEFERAQKVYDFLTYGTQGGASEGEGAQSGAKGGLTLAWQGRYPPFDWQFIDEREIRAQASRDGERLELYARPGQGGIVARRFLIGQSGTLRLVTDLEASRAFLPGRVRLAVFCSNAAEPMAEMDLSAGSNTLDVPERGSECAALRIDISARTLRGEPTLRASLGEVSLVSLSSTRAPGSPTDPSAGGEAP
ncbi:MAG: hypothetical protein AAFQ13_02030, partial [Pseudomonadota bacterium]